MRVQNFSPELVDRLNTHELARKFRREYPRLSDATFGRVAPMRRRENPVVGGMLEVINQPVYDSFSVASNTAVAKQVLFQTPIGQSAKTLNLTNMTKAGFLENPQRLTIFSIRLYLSNNALIIDQQTFLLNNSFVLTVGKKPMLEVPCLYLTSGCGAIVTAGAQVGTAPAGNTAYQSASNGMPDPRAVFTCDNPILIEQGEGFNVTINPEVGWSTSNAATPAATGITAYVFLDGELERGVQ